MFRFVRLECIARIEYALIAKKLAIKH